ncbi:MAG: HEAT repeat domain-containing protein [Planctomycetaceae bacterium]
MTDTLHLWNWCDARFVCRNHPRKVSGQPLAAAGLSRSWRLCERLGLLILFCTLPLAVHADAPAPNPPLTAERSSALLAEIESAAAKLQPHSPLQVRGPHLVYSLGRNCLAATSAYGEEQIRFLVVELIVANTSTEPQTLDVREIRLSADGVPVSWQSRPRKLDQHSFQAGTEDRFLRDVQPPDALSVPANGTAATWMLFAPLQPGVEPPAMILEIPSEPRPLRLDINLYEQARLRLQQKRLGPSECLAQLTVEGQLNTINSVNLTKAIDKLSATGVKRFVVEFASQSAPLHHVLLDWLRQSQEANPYVTPNRQLPTFPANLTELQFVSPQVTKDEGLPHWHQDRTPAVVAALASAMSVIPGDEVIRSLRSKDRAEQIAALSHGVSQLTLAEFPLVQRFLSDEDPDVRRAALQALGQFDTPAATAALATMTAANDSDDAIVAIQTLASSRFPAAYTVLTKLIAAGQPVVNQRFVTVLANHPRPEWQPTLTALTLSPDSKVQQAALQALARLGDAHLLEILSKSLRSEDARIREEAFQQLAKIESREADELAGQYVLERLQHEPPTFSMRQFLERVRDQRAVPLLLPYLEQPETVRRGVIELLGSIGDQRVADELLRRYPQLSDSEKVLVLDAWRSLRSAVGIEAAIGSLQAKDLSLVQKSIEYLQPYSSKRTVDALATAVRQSMGETAQSATGFLCNGLGAIGTPHAREALLELRKNSTDERVQQAAQVGLQLAWAQSPARDILMAAQRELMNARRFALAAKQGMDAVDEEQQVLTAERISSLIQQHLATADRLLTSAHRLDSANPELLLLRAEWHVVLEEHDQAITAFQSALQENPDLVEAQIGLGSLLYELERFDDAIPWMAQAFENDVGERRHQWLTTWALSLVRVGKIEDALELVRTRGEELPANVVFDYNRACIFGRAVEQLQQDPNVAADDPRLTVFSEKSVQFLQQAFEGDIEDQTRDPRMADYMRNDPDLQPLHRFSAFRKFAQLDLPENQRGRPVPQTVTPPPPGGTL